MPIFVRAEPKGCPYGTTGITALNDKITNKNLWL